MKSVILLILTLLVAVPFAGAQTSLYPDFVLDLEAASDSATAPATENLEDVLRGLDEDLAEALQEALEERDAPVALLADRSARLPQVLAFDLVSSGTWLGARNRLEHLVEDMRIAILSDAPIPEFTGAANEFLVTLDIIGEMAPLQAPFQADGIEFQRGRLERQTLYMMQDYAAGDTRRVASTNRLLTRSMAELGTLLARSDIERGWAAVDYTQLPGGWDPGEFSSPGFAVQIRSWTGRQLISEYRRHHERLQHAYRTRTIGEHIRLTYEMGELARELARRTDEVPTLSREPFRNASLRLDVQAENLRDFLVESKRLHARRQLFAMGVAIRDAERFLELVP